MDDTILRQAAGAAGYRLATDRLTEAAIEQPEHVANWIAAAARYIATGRIQCLLNDAARQLRDRLVGRPATQFRADAEALAAVGDLLADINKGLDEALRDLGRHSLPLARLDQPPLIDDPATTALPAALAGRHEASGGDAPAARVHHVACGNPLPPGRRRPRRPQR